jgi:hypothetical protein
METSKRMSSGRLLWIPGLALLLAGCASPSMYSWGHYEDLVYVMYAAPGKATPEVQIIKLEEDYQKARSKNKPVPPGFHSHLGYLYYQVGKLDQAKVEFETEKARFPESKVFMDRLLAGFTKQ